jgi:hypothetical protein
MCAVEWLTILSTAVGAMAALVGTVLAYKVRSRDEAGREFRAERRHSYIDFLVALDAAHGELRVVADSAAGTDRRTAAALAMTESHVYEAREKLLMSASPAVIKACEQAFRSVGDLRKAIRAGARTGEKEYHDPYHVFAEALWRLRLAIRQDLGGTALSPADLDKQSWDGRADCPVCEPEMATVP